jgi:hypothetical protein
MKKHGGSGVLVVLGTRWGLLTSFTPLSLYAWKRAIASTGKEAG